MSIVLRSLLAAFLVALSATTALAQETPPFTLPLGNGRTAQCVVTHNGAQQTSQCTEVNGPYISTCVGTTVNGVLQQHQNCTDNYGNSWDPAVSAAPPLPPANQPPGSAAPPPPAPAPSGPCEFKLGFKALHDLIPDVVGDCVADETHNPQNGDGLQQTAHGLLVWRKADNWTAFTNGSMTWINGPEGLQSRPNDQRFPWEGAGA